MKNVKGIKLSGNLYGELDTPPEIYKVYKQGNYDLEDIKKLISKYPDRAECYALLGDFYEKNNDLVNAEASYSKAISLNPNNAAYYCIRGFFFIDIGNFYDCIDDLTYIIEHKDLKNQSYYTARGHRLIAACCVGDWKTAKEDIEYIEDNYVTYLKPVAGRITKGRLLNSIKNRKLLECKK